MPGKSRSKKEKKFFKPVAISQQPASISPSAVNVRLNEPSSGVKPASTPAAAAAKAAAAATTYINRELLTITLMTGMMLVIVIVVSVLLRGG